MAFYPDELSPIDRIRSLGKPTDSLTEVGSLKNRRQWKSLVLGKKDMGMNNFATIAEEKEDEMSSDGSQEAHLNKDGPGGSMVTPGVVVANKKITFPKPRKYITSRVSDKREDSLRGVGGPVSFSSLGASVKEPADSGADVKKTDQSNASIGLKSETKQSTKSVKSKEVLTSAQDFIQNYVLNETPIESQWNDAFSEGLMSWPKPVTEKINLLKHDTTQGVKTKQEEKKKPSENSKSPGVADAANRDAKGGKKKGSSTAKKPAKAAKKELPSTSVATTSRSAPKAEKGKTLNMKEVVNVYKNLAYGSKDEIKTFVENLSFVKDEAKAENDKDLLSMMNLKALENKIKNFAKKSGKNQEASTSKEKKSKPEKVVKRNRKAHIEKLARHKIVKVPAVLNKSYSKNTSGAVTENKVAQQKKKNVKDKEPWKYVGMESVLDKTYFVYPAYPPSVNMKNTTKTKKVCVKGAEKAVRKTKGNSGVAAAAASNFEPKVKGPQVVLRPNSFSGVGSQNLNVSGSASNKSMNRSSATTVCTVEFRPVGRKTEEPPLGVTDQSLLVYLHGTKAIHVNSPYADKQFSRVKLFRKSERGMPLIKGLGQRVMPKGCKNVSVRKISLPEKLTRFRSLDLLDFDEDIENITDFLRSQDTHDRQPHEKWEGAKKTERWPKETPKEQEPRQSRQPDFDNPHHQHGTPRETFSPDSIINEISKNIRHLQYLPDTEDNRKMIGQFFDELDHQIEASRKGALAFRFPDHDSFKLIPILGY